jgi:hypothetical protein
MQREIKIIVTAPNDCTEEQFKEWVNFELEFTGLMDRDNPLYEFSLVADKVEFLD